MSMGSILAIDDDMDYRELYSDILSQKGCEIVTGILSVQQKCLKMVSIMDLDSLLYVILDSIMAETNAQGSVLWLASHENRDELRLSAARGVINISTEVEAVSLSAHSNSDMIKGGKPFYEKSSDGGEVNENAFFVPLKVEDNILGLIKVSDKLDRERFEIKDMMIVKTIAGFASIAVRNALKVREMEYKGFKDPRTNTYHINYFTDYVTKEINKAGRYQRTFSILYLKIENYNELRGEFQDSALSDAIQGVINAALGVIRDADILAMARKDEYYILLPETDYFGSLMSIRKISKALKGKTFVSAAKKSTPLEIGMRSVSFPKDGVSLKNLLDNVGKRMEESRKSFYARHKLGEMAFWKIFDTLVGKGEDYPLSLIEGKAEIKGERKGFEDEEGFGRNVLFTPHMLFQIQEVIFSEIDMNSDTRGILYMGARNMEDSLALLRRHQKIAGSATKVFLLGEKADKGWELPAATPVFVAGDEIEKARFLIFLSVDYAYAMFLRVRDDGMYYGIHTSDPIFVENIIAKLQENYHLQVQL